MIQVRLLLAFFSAAFVLRPARLLADNPYGLEHPAAIAPYLDGRMPELGPGISGNWSAELAFPDLSFKNALGVVPEPENTRLYVWEREGRVYSFESCPDVKEKKLVLDISRQCQGWDDSGLLGMALHPNFAANHYLYVWYAWVPPGTVRGDPEHRPDTGTANRDRLARYTVSPDGIADPASETVLIDQPTHVVWHKGGGMFFHPKTGFLYLTIGDDEDGSNSQRIDHNLLGGLLRIDVDQRGGNVSHPIRRQPAEGHTASYFIPNDNPFVGTPDALEEFYGIGLRSPHRMTHDGVTGRTFIGDVGDATREEIDIIEANDPPGLNFQWPIIEGLRGDLTPPYIGVNKRPVIDYDHGEGNAVIGGYVYRGKKWADDLGGKYIFGDNGTGKIWVLDERTVPASKVQLCLLPFGPGPNSGSNYTGLSSFGIDADNELYLCQMSSQAGHLYRLKRDGPPSVRKPFPNLLSQTGAFTNTAALVPASALIPYTANSPLWSDGAVKSRWMVLPTGGKIKFAEKGEWTFPDGTVFVKHFELPTDERHPEVRRRLETRILVRDATGSAYGVTYKWRDDNSDADLVSESISQQITIQTADGGTRTQTWTYPSQTDCIRCHTPAAGYVLGVNTRQLNAVSGYGPAGRTVKDNQLRTLNHLQLFDLPLDEKRIAGFDRLASVSDESVTIEHRVRSYLDANCAHCHRPGGVHALWDARFDTPLAQAGILNGPAINHLNIQGSKIIRPADPDRSLIVDRVAARDPAGKMPPLARNEIDLKAEALLAKWVAALPPTAQLAKPWLADDIGAVGQAGDTMFRDGVFTVMASGSDIWDSADGFQFASQPLKGDGQITAHVLSISDGDDWEKAGVMIRSGTQAGAQHAFMAMTHTQGASFQRRTTADQSSGNTDAGGLHSPYWVRLQRRGNVFSGAISAEGNTWTAVGSETIAMPADVLVGLAVTAHNNGAICTATFDQVKVQSGSR